MFQTYVQTTWPFNGNGKIFKTLNCLIWLLYNGGNCTKALFYFIKYWTCWLSLDIKCFIDAIETRNWFCRHSERRLFHVRINNLQKINYLWDLNLLRSQLIVIRHSREIFSAQNTFVVLDLSYAKINVTRVIAMKRFSRG